MLWPPGEPARGARSLPAALLLTSGQLAMGAISAQAGASMQTDVDHQQRQQGEARAASSAPAAMSPAEMKTSFPLYMRLIATLVCLVIFTVGVCGNLLVPLVVIKTRYLRNSTNLFLINLSVADLLVLIVCMPLVLVELHSRPETWLLGESMCKVSNFVEMLAANGSIFTILAISFERYYAICKPLKAGYKCTRLRATIIICLIWLLACILTSPILMMAKSVQTTYIDGSLVDNCILETDSYWPKMYVFVSMFAFFCLPLLVLMLVYWLISRRLIRETIAMTNSTGSPLVAASSPRAGGASGSATPLGLAGGPHTPSKPASAAEWRTNHISSLASKRFVRDGSLERADVANEAGQLAAGRAKAAAAAAGQRQRRLQQVTRSLTEDHAPYERNKLVGMRSVLAPLTNTFRHAERGLEESQHDCNHDSKSALSADESDTSEQQQQSNSISGLDARPGGGPRREHSMSKVNLIAMAHNISNNFHIKRAKARSGSQPLVTHHLQGAQNGSEQLHCASHLLSKRHQMDSRRQVVVMLAFVVACFFLLFAPYRVFTIWLILSTEDQVQSLGMEAYYNLTYFSRILIYLHSAINPIAYNLISTKFRRAFMSILLCRGPESRRQFTTDTYRHAHEAATKTFSSRLNSKVNRSSSQNTTHTTSDRMISIRIVDVYANEHEVNDDLVP